MNDLVKSIGRGFTGVLRFGGRASRAGFWPYAILVFGLGQLAALAAMMPVVVRIQRHALDQAGRQGIETGSDAPSMAMFEDGEGLVAFASDMILLGSLVTMLAVALLAAAVVRRLHDCDRRGYWGLLPLPFLASAAILTPKALAGIARDKPDMSTFSWLFANNMVYFATLAWLIYLLAAVGTPGPNRFGPPPE